MITKCQLLWFCYVGMLQLAISRILLKDKLILAIFGESLENSV